MPGAGKFSHRFGEEHALGSRKSRTLPVRHTSFLSVEALIDLRNLEGQHNWFSLNDGTAKRID
jgi:hypothetical protein